MSATSNLLSFLVHPLSPTPYPRSYSNPASPAFWASCISYAYDSRVTMVVFRRLEAVQASALVWVAVSYLLNAHCDVDELELSENEEGLQVMILSVDWF
ncbi:hypothetical protein ABKN59_010265 [Abortiporus biennis]